LFSSGPRSSQKSFFHLGLLKAESAVLDGEIVYLGTDGRPEFYNLMRRRTPQHFYAFDRLWLDGKDFRELLLIERKRILRRMVPSQPAPLLYADYFDGRGVDLFRRVCDRTWKGSGPN
jgi:bifunctional non-homologous end joining protein LigD